MNPIAQFMADCRAEVDEMGKDAALRKQSVEWLNSVTPYKYSYHFAWQGRPIIQYPQDMIALQELIWTVKPDLIIETGIAHGGSLVLSASMLALLDMYDTIEAGVMMDPKISRRKVLGIDIDIRAHNRTSIESHPLASRIQMIQGSSIASEVVEEVRRIAKGNSCVMVCLDSNHTHEHVLAELRAYAPLTSVGSYCIVFDTAVEDMDSDLIRDRPWGPGNNPKTAVGEYLRNSDLFVIDEAIHNKLLITMATGGYLKRVK